MKKLTYFLLGAVFFAGVAYAAPITTSQVTLLPQTTNLFDLGTSTKVWRDAFITRLCLSGDCKTAWPSGGGGGGGSGNVATSSGETQGFLSYWTSTNATPALLGKVGTTTLTASSPLALSNPVAKVGGVNSVLTLDTSGTWAGLAGTASALAANPTNCSAGNAFLGIAANGDVESCFDVWTQAENTSAAYIAGVTADSPLSGSGTSASHLTISTAGTWSGNAGTATKLATARAINGVNFDGTAPITIASTTLLTDFNTFTQLVTGSISGNAGTATALAANPTNCSAGNYPLGIDASGNVENCTSAGAASSTLLGDANTWSGINTWGSGLLRATSPRITTSLFDANGAKILGLTPAVSADTFLTIVNSVFPADPKIISGGSGGAGTSINFDPDNANSSFGALSLTPWSNGVGPSDQGIEIIPGRSTGNFPTILAASSTVLNDASLSIRAKGAGDILLREIGTGNVGLGTTTPRKFFAVQGSGLFSGDLSVAGLTATGTIAFPAGSISNATLANSTISGKALGTSLSALTATNGTLTFSGSYDGSGAQTVGLNLGNPNIWTVLQNFALSTSTQLSALQAYFGATATSTFSTAGDLTLGGFLKIPNAVDPTIDATGKFALNTTIASTSLRVHDGTAERAVYAAQDHSVVFASSSLAYYGAFGASGTTTTLIANYNRPTTMLNFYCKTDIGTAWVGFGNGTATTTEINCSTAGVNTILAANNTWTMRQNFFVEVGRSGSSPNLISITASIRPDAD